VNTYADALGTATCAECVEHSQAPAVSDVQTDCLCSLGFFGPHGGPCAECAANAYADALGTAASRLLRAPGRALRRVRGEHVRGLARHGELLRVSPELRGPATQRR
jgi:hypothetical protein